MTRNKYFKLTRLMFTVRVQSYVENCHCISYLGKKKKLIYQFK